MKKNIVDLNRYRLTQELTSSEYTLEEFFKKDWTRCESALDRLIRDLDSLEEERERT